MFFEGRGLRSSTPPVPDVVPEGLFWEYHETIMRGAGDRESGSQSVDAPIEQLLF
jgi:hypothetical protein